MKKIIAMLKGKDQSGISVILVAMLLTVLVGFVAFAIDIGYIRGTQSGSKCSGCWRSGRC